MIVKEMKMIRIEATRMKVRRVRLKLEKMRKQIVYET